MKILSRICLMLIRGYQILLSPLLGKRCRYYPSCSHYTAEAIRRFGAFRGVFLGGLRICRCHPFNPGGHDPVPKAWINPFRCGGGCDKNPVSSEDMKRAA